jgi:hypothetical protein
MDARCGRGIKNKKSTGPINDAKYLSVKGKARKL